RAVRRQNPGRDLAGATRIRQTAMAVRAILLATAAAAAALPRAAGQAPLKPPKAELLRWEQQAQAVTIMRDRYGVPHVHGRTDADASFGMSYARSQDRYQETEPAYIQRSEEH